jgi:capsular exopolysaccharide synthesis family protein
VPPFEQTHAEPTLSDYLAIIRRHRWVIVLTTVILPLVAYTLSAQQPNVYSASSEVLLNRQDIGSALTGVPNVNAYSDPDRYARTQAALARTPDVARRTLERAGVQDTPANFLSHSAVTPQENADLLRFNVSGSNPETVARLVNAYSEAFTRYKLEMDTQSLQTARKELQGRLGELRKQGAVNTEVYRDLLKKEQDLRTIELLQARPTVVRQAAAAGQIAPTPKRSAILGAILGLALGVGLAFAWNALDKRIRSAEEVETVLGIPLLARLPKPSRGSKGLAMLSDPNDVEAESVRRLRTSLELANLEAQAKVIMVTSPAAVQGKSTTIANLGVALARSGRTVALVDLDLRQPMIATFFGIESLPGVTDVALGRVALQDALHRVRIPGPTRGTGIAATSGRLRVLASGSPPPSPGEFVGTQALAQILERLRSEHDLVLVDAPPMLAVGDAMTISTRVDGMFAVVRLGHTDRAMLRDFSRGLHASPAHKLGFVLTGVEARDMYGGANYGYVRDRPPTSESDERSTLRDVSTSGTARSPTR